MFDSTIHASNLDRYVLKSDFLTDPHIAIDWYRAHILSEAAEIGGLGFVTLDIDHNVLRGKSVYRLTSLAQNLVLRQVAANIRRITAVKQDDRQQIVRCIRSLCAEGVSFRIYKFDIKSFYESVDPSHITKRLSNDVMFSGQSTRVITSFFRCLQAQGITGLPRGMGISATLSEYLLRSFDQSLSEMDGVLFTARYVDDIIVITNGSEKKENFSANVVKQLPLGLSFNNKSAIYDFSEFVRGTKTGTTAHKFTYLGYQIEVSTIYQSSSVLRRSSLVDISPNKVRKYKTRFALSLLDYQRTHDFELLYLRVRMLTSNFAYIDANTGRKRLSGIYFNYAMVDAPGSSALDTLDNFLKGTVTCKHQKNRLYPRLTHNQANEIVRHSFRSGFERKRFFTFTPSQLARITECWAHA